MNKQTRNTKLKSRNKSKHHSKKKTSYNRWMDLCDIQYDQYSIPCASNSNDYYIPTLNCMIATFAANDILNAMVNNVTNPYYLGGG